MQEGDLGLSTWIICAFDMDSRAFHRIGSSALAQVPSDLRVSAQSAVEEARKWLSANPTAEVTRVLSCPMIYTGLLQLDRSCLICVHNDAAVINDEASTLVIPASHM